MSFLKPEYIGFVALASGVMGISIFLSSPVLYLNAILLLLVLGILVITRDRCDRGFYLVCGSEPLVISCSIMNLWAGLFVVCVLAGIIYSTLGFLESRQDFMLFALFCGSSTLVALLIQLSNHVLLPLLILAGTIAIIIVIQSVRTYQFRKNYTGA